MIRSSELELQARAQALFECENPGRLWRFRSGLAVDPSSSQPIAGLIERQVDLARVQERMQAEGALLTTDDEALPQPVTTR